MKTNTNHLTIEKQLKNLYALDKKWKNKIFSNSIDVYNLAEITCLLQGGNFTKIEEIFVERDDCGSEFFTKFPERCVAVIYGILRSNDRSHSFYLHFNCKLTRCRSLTEAIEKTKLLEEYCKLNLNTKICNLEHSMMKTFHDKNKLKEKAA